MNCFKWRIVSVWGFFRFSFAFDWLREGEMQVFQTNHRVSRLYHHRLLSRQLEIFISRIPDKDVVIIAKKNLLYLFYFINIHFQPFVTVMNMIGLVFCGSLYVICFNNLIFVCLIRFDSERNHLSGILQTITCSWYYEDCSRISFE